MLFLLLHLAVADEPAATAGSTTAESAPAPVVPLYEAEERRQAPAATDPLRTTWMMIKAALLGSRADVRGAADLFHQPYPYPAAVHYGPPDHVSGYATESGAPVRVWLEPLTGGRPSIELTPPAPGDGCWRVSVPADLALGSWKVKATSPRGRTYLAAFEVRAASEAPPLPTPCDAFCQAVFYAQTAQFWDFERVVSTSGDPRVAELAALVRQKMHREPPANALVCR